MHSIKKHYKQGQFVDFEIIYAKGSTGNLNQVLAPLMIKCKANTDVTFATQGGKFDK